MTCPACQCIRHSLQNDAELCRECQEKQHERQLAAEAWIYTAIVYRWLRMQPREA